MKKHLAILTSTLLLCSSVILFSFNQDEPKEIRFNGMYISKTNEISLGDRVIETYNYIRFYEDGTVICQSVGGNEPAKVAEWFHTGEGGKYERKGYYIVTGRKISFTVNNDGTEDKELEGAKKDAYDGEIIGPDQLFLTLTYNSGNMVQTTYEFAADTGK